MDIKRASHVTTRQKELLVNFINEHADMNSGKFTQNFTKATSRKLWQDVTNLLNSVPGAPAKEWRQWRKCWTDIKKNTKSKVANNRRERIATGGGIPVIQPVDDMENMVIEIMTPTTIMGDRRISKPVIEFDLDSADNIEEPVSLNMGEILVDAASEEDHYHENAHEHTYCNEIHNIEKDIEVKELKSSTSQKKKFVSKSTRLTKSLENSAELLFTSKKKLEVVEKYHEKKLLLMERDINNREIFMKNQTQLGENILKQLTEIKEILL